MALINGNNSNNGNLNGTASNDQIFGFDGDDALSGNSGDDYLDGGNGDDQLGLVFGTSQGEAGNDIFIGGAGDDRLGAGPGNDTAYGGEGNDRIFADFARVRSTGGGDDYVVGGPGSDAMAGGDGFDIAYFDLPRRAYAIEVASFEFPNSNFSFGTNPVEQGVRITTGAGPAAEVDLLIEFEELRFVDGRIVVNPNDVAAQVYRVFEAGLDRAPDPIGFNFWGAQIAAGVPLNAFGNSVVQSPEFQARYGALDNAAFVQQLYQNVLGRPGEAAGVNGWVGALNASATRGDVLVGFANSQENVNNIANVLAAGLWDQDERAAQVVRLYDTAFNRLPDLGGFLSNKASLDAGLSLEQLARNYSQSAEFAVLYGGPNVAPQALVNALYLNILNRPADADGLAFWTQRIQSGAQTREQVIVAFSESLEHQILMLPSIEGGVVFT